MFNFYIFYPDITIQFKIVNTNFYLLFQIFWPRSARSRRQKSSRLAYAADVLERRRLLTTFVVDDLNDAVDATPGDGSALTVGGTTTLRAAIQEANALAGDDIIQLPAGIIQLLLFGSAENASATGDLDISSNLTIEGISAAGSIIEVNDIDRGFDLQSGVTVTLRNLTLQNATIFIYFLQCEKSAM